MPYSFSLAAILAGNLLCLGLMNALRLPVGWTAWVWPGAVLACWRMLRPDKLRRAPFAMPRAAWWLCGAALILLTVPRLTYVAEWLPGTAVLAQADDYGRLAELVSMTQSARYPLEHPGNQDLLLSHYYAALYPMAWIKTALPFLTLKDSIVLGNLLYHLLMLGALLECAPRLVRRRRGALLLVFLMTLFGGFDILMGSAIPFEHTEHWARSHMGRPRELSSMYTAMYWTVHHAAALWASVLAYVLVKAVRYGARWRKPLACGWLLAAAGASSAFVALTVPLVAWKELWALARRLLKLPWVLAACAGASWAPLWLVMKRVDAHGWRWNPPEWNIAVYVAAVCAIDLAGIPLWLSAQWQRLTGEERRWLIGFAVFAALTWGLESAGYNNFMMRGGLVPAACLMVAVARHAVPRWLAVVFLATAVTTVRESATLTYWGLENSNWYWQARGLAVPEHVQQRLRAAYPRVARDARGRYYQPDAGDRRGMDKYNAERMVRGLKVEEMAGAEREIARYRD